MRDIIVSICCTTYNHEKYIGDAIESFLMQKCNFLIEILIHDDASTDNTSRIIKEYENKYPNVIKPIYQTENQYSKGVRVSKFNNERAKGKYIALCEGDDYWTDPYKLQKQVDYLEKHSECSLVVHAAKLINATNSRVINNIRPSKTNRIFSVKEVILRGGGLFPTNSMVFRNKYYKILPNFYYNAPVGDYPLCIFLSLKGQVYYINELMSDYRFLVPGSWTANEFNVKEKKIKHFKEISKMLDEINMYTNYKYSNEIEMTKSKNEFYLLINQGKYTEAKKGKTSSYYISLDFTTKINIIMRQYFPDIFSYLKKIKGKIINAKSEY